MQTITIIINELPYKNDKAWNALRLVGELLDQDVKVKIFLLEDGVDVGKENQEAKGKEYNLEELTKELLAKNVPFVACSSCLKVCGISREKLIDGIVVGHMSDLANLIKESDKVLTF
ncbi:MAG: sulfurtransferase [Candidatus Magasanikbacteria bacterium]|nr:sulfurtransferase [Candidatus Magasanikbacteria bacterium]